MTETIKIALAGNPNCGKTTMFNALTGSTQYVGNWPGVTVEKKDGRLKGHKNVIIQDLPGIYSLSPYSMEEIISRNYLVQQRPDAIINIVDASNIERNLYLTTQILEIGIPTVIALNMIDIANKCGDKIDAAALEKQLGCPVVEMAAINATGINTAAEKAIELAKAGTRPITPTIYTGPAQTAIEQISSLLKGEVADENLRWFSVKTFERDEKTLEHITLTADKKRQIEQIIATAEAELNEDSESIITNERYAFIDALIAKAVKRGTAASATSEKIDKVLTNRFLALPIFACVMFAVYYIAISSLGSVLTDWANDGVFGDGWRLFGIGSSAYEEAAGDYDLAQAEIDAYITAAAETGLDTAAAEAALEDGDTAALAAWANDTAAAGITANVQILDEETEELLETVPVNAETVTGALAVTEPDPADFGIWIPGIPVLIESLLVAINCADWLQSLVLDGIVGGVGAVLGFVPQMMILFILLAILEDCGYMSRVAFIMDKLFRKFGLSGKNFIPMLVATGCGVPGVMASRTIENESERKLSIITTTFMPCGAKLPIIALISGALFPSSAWVAPATYFIGIAAIAVSGIILKKTRYFAGDPSPFVLELPNYHMPQPKNVLLHMWERSKSFIKKACTIIMLSTIVLWFLGSYNLAMQPVDTGDSMLASVGQTVAPVFTPLGWGDKWEAAVGTVTGLIAKENVVATFGSLYAGMDEVSEDGHEFWTVLAAQFTPLAAFSFMLFNLLCAPCFAAIGAIHREMGNKKLTAFAVAYQCGLAYVAAMVVYQLGMLVNGGGFGLWTIVSLVLLAGFLFLLLRPNPYKNGVIKPETINK